MKVFLDTNVLIAGYATRGLCFDLVREVLTHHELLVGSQVLAEVGCVLRVKLRAPEALVLEIETSLSAHLGRQPRGSLPDLAIRDPDDLGILAEALAAGADLLVTGDHDLLDIAELSPVRILSPRHFWELVRPT